MKCVFFLIVFTTILVSVNANFKCFECMHGDSSSVLYGIAMQHVLPDELKKNGLKVPKFDTNCQETPATPSDTSETCKSACVTFNIFANFTGYKGPSPPLDFGINDMSQLKETKITIRGCLDKMVDEIDADSLQKDLGLGEEEDIMEIGCLRAKGHLAGGAFAGQLCLCRGDRCNMHPSVMALPEIKNNVFDPKITPEKSFNAHECYSAHANENMMHMIAAIASEAFPMVESYGDFSSMNTTIRPDSTKTDIESVLKEYQGAMTDEKCYADQTDQPSEGGCKSSLYGVTLGLAADFKGYYGPKSLGGENGINSEDIKSLDAAKFIGRTCLDQMLGSDNEELKVMSQAFKDDMCVWVDSNMMGIQAQAMGCACNSEKCNSRPFLMKSAGKLGLEWMVLFSLLSFTVTKQLFAY